MAAATVYLQYWALAFATLSLALVLLTIFYRLIDLDLQLHRFGKEIAIAVLASAVQGAGFWLSASLFHGNPFRRLVLPGAIVAVVYWFTHLEDWSGYEIGGIAYFQAALLTTGLFVYQGEFQLALLILGLFAFGLVIVAGTAKNL